MIVIHLGPNDGSIPALPNLDETYGDDSANIKNYTEVVAEDAASVPPSAYVAAEFSPLVFGAENTIEFISGNSSQTADVFDEEIFLNGPLIAAHAYTVIVRGYIDQGSRRRRATQAVSLDELWESRQAWGENG